MKEKTRELIKIGMFSLIGLAILLLFFVGVLGRMNSDELTYCKMLDGSGLNVAMDKGIIFEKCLVKEDGEYISISDYQKKHKYDGMKIIK